MLLVLQQGNSSISVYIKHIIAYLLLLFYNRLFIGRARIYNMLYNKRVVCKLACSADVRGNRVVS